ncbi:enolase C-terminal domain-like protein [Granulicella tundricola]|uniref:Mandelate racemase/muconate lactonizing protein n=1 Tax=Granulicella tundricola (strain ATCC BAA-1859 / DSM 23138 / MP5ACTX9) TaxID=1198114 RepID=E8X749_GRATM|nr:enolase C-terminal domain-like protein [Granulicella tundricola]ADW71283.1 Mandelate racemase/muconate lactonizing protein [Granulicella tundricola MP5ACTX9]
MNRRLQIHNTRASAFTIPTDGPEADGTFAWDSTTLIVVEISVGGKEGIGYTYSHAVTASLALDLMQKTVEGADPFETSALFVKMRRMQRNYGSQGIAATALSAIDMALWDLKAKLLDLPLVNLLGRIREKTPVYVSGGFTTYTDSQLSKQLAGWVEQGIPRVKMKIGTHPDKDVGRVKTARRAIGAEAELFVDANGAYTRKQALDFAYTFHSEYGVNWFEEPVSSDDLAGLRLLRDQGPGGMEIAAGEYAWREFELRAMLEAGAVDVLQADATRCGGVTGFMAAAALAEAHDVPLSAHCGPTAHLHLACAAKPLRHVEYFHDHARIEAMLFDGFRSPVNGDMEPDLSRPGLGFYFKHQDAEPYRTA